MTIQHYLLKNTLDEAASQSAAEQFGFLRYVVEQEDYATGIRQQVALASGARKMVTFGKNESGGARFHVVDQLLETSDSELTSLFQALVDPIAELLDRTNEGESKMNKAENHEVVPSTPTMTFVRPCFSNKRSVYRTGAPRRMANGRHPLYGVRAAYG